MKKLLTMIVVAALCAVCTDAEAATWPDGSPMDAWFADRSPVNEASLGPLRRAQEFGAKPEGFRFDNRQEAKGNEGSEAR